MCRGIVENVGENMPFARGNVMVVLLPRTHYSGRPPAAAPTLSASAVAACRARASERTCRPLARAAAGYYICIYINLLLISRVLWLPGAAREASLRQFSPHSEKPPAEELCMYVCVCVCIYSAYIKKLFGTSNDTELEKLRFGFGAIRFRPQREVPPPPSPEKRV
jgi:hypothetical protein